MKHRRAVAKAALAEFGVAGLVRQALPLVLAGFLLWYLAGHLATIDPQAVFASLRQIHPVQWALAVLATAVSFWAVGRYDGVLHRQLGSHTPSAQAHRAGVAAIAISQTLGMGLFTGALVRWRMLPDHTLWQATRISLAVALSFLAGWAVVAATILLVLPLPVPFLRPAAALFLACAATAAVLSVLRPGPLAFRRLPPLRTVGRIVALAAIDTGAAAAAFMILMPHTGTLGWMTILPAFMVALGAGLSTGTPGGVGPFEIVLLSLLPETEPAPLLATILAFRLTYYALPAVIGGVLVILGPRRVTARTAPLIPAPAPALLMAQGRAEYALTTQGPFSLWSNHEQTCGWMLAETAQALVALGDPVGPVTLQSSADLRALAAYRDRVMAHYKCSARVAAGLRRQGYAVVQTGQEALLDLQTFALETPSRAPLRRKLRKADRAGLSLAEPKGGLPLADMAAVSAQWAGVHGGERGFSMGQFHPETLRHQRCFLAWQGDRLVAFVSFHHNAQEWSLDLMRHACDAPDGTMYALIAAAIAQAQSERLPLLSLAAVPAERGGRLARLIERATGAGGLRQFKSTFAPTWRPVYLAAPSHLSLCLAGIDIARTIARPPPLRQANALTS